MPEFQEENNKTKNQFFEKNEKKKKKDKPLASMIENKVRKLKLLKSGMKEETLLSNLQR